MSGLVGYGSSSEDEDDLPPIAAFEDAASSNYVTHDSGPLTNGSGSSSLQQDKAAVTSIQGPMVGPSMPTNAVSADEEFEDGMLADLPPMSEQDLLRYLTQPSHPMASLPPEPSNQADTAVTTKFERYLELKKKGIHFNEDLSNKSSFKNPSLFASLLERIGLPPGAQYSSSLPADVFSLDLFPSWAYKDALSQSQQTLHAENEITKKAQSTSGKRTIQFTPAVRTMTESGEPASGVQTKRKRP